MATDRFVQVTELEPLSYERFSDPERIEIEYHYKDALVNLGDIKSIVSLPRNNTEIHLNDHIMKVKESISELREIIDGIGGLPENTYINEYVWEIGG